jgi:hypothetical protein
MQKIKLIDESLWLVNSCQNCGAELIVKTMMTSRWMDGLFQNVLEMSIPRCGCELEESK